MSADQPTLPDWHGGCVADVVPAIIGSEPSTLLDEQVTEARTVVLFVIDGLGWNQLQAHRDVAPTLASLAGRAITSVAPSTTSVALTSIVTGTHPGEHGIVGYRIAVDGDVLNCLSWRTSRGDARRDIVPEEFQTIPAFRGERPVVVQNAPFAKTGFTRAHLSGVRQNGWRTLPTLPVQVRHAVAAGEPFVYVYYDGIDKIAHEFSFGEHYRAELAAVDAVVSELMMDLPRDAALVVTADHGLVDCANGRTELPSEVSRLTRSQSGEARFRWLHSNPGRSRDLLVVARDHLEGQAWVRGVEEVLDEGWLGPSVTEQARSRLGDVAVVARDDRWFVDPAEGPNSVLIGRHGGLTDDEMLVPLLHYAN